MTVPAWSLLVTSAIPVGKVFILCGAGVILAHVGILDARGRKTLSSINFYCFIPALTYTKLATAVDLHNIHQWWFLPVNVLLGITLGMAVGWLFTVVAKPPKHLRRHVLCAVALGNVGNLPMVLVAGLCSDAAGQLLPSQPDAVACAETGIAYVVFAMWVAGLFQFSVAFNLLRPPADPLLGEVTADASAVVSTGLFAARGWGVDKARVAGGGYQALSAAADTGAYRAGGGAASGAQGNPGWDHEGVGQPCDNEQLELQPLRLHVAADDRERADTPAASSHPGEVGIEAPVSGRGGHGAGLSAAELRPLHPRPCGDTPSSATGVGAPAERPGQPARLPAWSPVRAPAWRLLAGRLKRVKWSNYLNLPTTCAFFGLATGCTPWAKGLLVGAGAPLAPLMDCLRLLAAPMIPCMMLVLGAVLYKGPGTPRLPARLIAGVVALRLLLMPLCGMALVLGLLRMGWISPPDEIFLVVLLLAHSTPTAINMQTVATLHQNGEAEMSCLLFWQYVCSFITLPLLLALYLHIAAQ
ncbi:hypothetical protein WJX81_002851 [Elliptochloris bilobata]|uniref:Auxin efflux carrier n=1 Tax=Elliptochloris bilobata TaxID=381761 RepID=A0AAW1S2G8_9CHLO